MSSRRARGDRRVDVALVAAAMLASVVALGLPDSRAEATAAMLRRTAFAPLVSLQTRAEHVRRAIAALDSTTAQRDSIAMHAYDATWLAEENLRLRSLMELGDRLSWSHVAADVLHGPPRGEPRTLLLRAGSAQGVEPFSPVVTADGVVGYVRSTDSNTSVAILWAHPDFRVSVIAADGDAFGIVAPYAGTEDGQAMLELRGVPYRAPLDSGTLVVSSGLGGTFPRGVPVGTILRELLPGESTWERSYLVVPAARAAGLGTVLVLTSAGRAGDLSAAWQAADSAESRE